MARSVMEFDQELYPASTVENILLEKSPGFLTCPEHDWQIWFV